MANLAFHYFQFNLKAPYMTLEEGKEKFIQSWGALGSSWGINRTMAQIHALLYLSEKPLTADEIQETLLRGRS